MDDMVEAVLVTVTTHTKKKKIEFLILVEARRAMNRTAGLNFQRTRLET